MLNKTQIKKLAFLSTKIQECKKCKDLYKNGMAVPYWSEFSEIMVIAEAPGESEVRKNMRTPLVGKAGRLFFSELKRKSIGFKREDLLILNTIQCRPVVNGRNGKPSKENQANCLFWINKYIEIFRPRVILTVGKYAMDAFIESEFGIKEECGRVYSIEILDGLTTKIIPCIHPASVLYSKSNIDYLRISLKTLAEVKN